MSTETSRLDQFVSPARRELWYRSYQRFTNQPMSVIGLIIVVTITIAAVFAPYIAPYPEHAGTFTDFANAFQQPSLEHPLGTDDVGRDILTRVLFGYRIALTLVAVVLGLGVPVGVTLGLTAGYAGGWIDTIIMRVTDTFLALPPLVLALAIASAFEPTLEVAMFAIASLWWTWYARLARGLAASQSDEEYIQAAKISGASTSHILFRELLPNCLSPLLVKATLDAGIVVLTGASLSFIGLGVQPPQPGLGTMVANGTNFLPTDWWIAIMPGIAIFILVMGFNMLGDGLRDLFDVEVEQ